jgi:hypothetical protein
MTTLALEVSNDIEDRPIWLFTKRPRPLELVQKSAPRPLLRFEQAITDAILLRAQANDEPVDRFAAELVARLSVALLRSVAIRSREADESAPGKRATNPSMEELIEQAYETLAAMIPQPLAARPARARVRRTPER